MKLNTAERAGKTGQRGNDLQDGYEDHFPASFSTVILLMLRIPKRQNPLPLYCAEFSVQKISIRIQ